MTTPPQLLLHGIDTVQCAYQLRPAGRSHIDFERLSVERERLRASKDREPGVIELGRQRFFLSPRGSALGFPFMINDEDRQIEFGQYNTPSFFVTYRSHALWRDGPQVLNEEFLAWARGLGYEPFADEGLSRVDFCFDYHVPVIDFGADDFVSLSSKDSQHRQEGKVQTFTMGRSDIVLRVYDKVAEIKQQSGKVWLYELWGRESEVWRIEWQVRKEALRRFGLYTFQDLAEQPGDLLRYLSGTHDTLRVPNGDSNRSRWPLHPLWVALQGHIQTLDSLGVRRVDGKGAAIRERKVRLAIATYGYLKRLAAIVATEAGTDAPSLTRTRAELDMLLEQLHDGMSWQFDVDKRIQAIALGEW